MAIAPILRFLLRNPMILFALLQIFCMYVSNLRSSVIVTPRYLAGETLAMIWSYNFYSALTGVLLLVTVSFVHLSGWNLIFH